MKSSLYKQKVPLLKNEFAERLKRLRKINKISQDELAGMLGVSRSTIIRWESIESEVIPSDLNHLVSLCEILDTEPMYLLCGLFNEAKESLHKKEYINIYSKYKTNPDFFLIVRGLMMLDNELLSDISKLLESIYSRLNL